MARRIQGKPVWVEVNTQRIDQAEDFYLRFFGWTRNSAHVAPWGVLTLFKNGERPVGTSFLALAAFQPTRWNVFFSGTPDDAAQKAERLGGGVVARPADAPGWGRTTEIYDPAGHAFTIIALETPDVADPAAPGDLLMVELRAPDTTDLADFYVRLLGYDMQVMGNLTYLSSAGYPRILLRSDPHAPLHHPWIPWFRSSSVGADQARAERFGAITQLAASRVPGIGDAAVLCDPAGGYFGIVTPED